MFGVKLNSLCLSIKKTNLLVYCLNTDNKTYLNFLSAVPLAEIKKYYLKVLKLLKVLLPLAYL